MLTQAVTIDGRDIYVLSDEVYEHVLFDGRMHASVLTHDELRAKSFAVFSFGKTLHATGIRVGYCIAPPELTRELRPIRAWNAVAEGTESVETAPVERVFEPV